MIDNLTDHYGEPYDLSTFVTSDDLEEAFENSSLEARIDELENLSFCQDQNDRNSEKIKALVQENQELKDRILTLENFLLKTFKEFNND